MSNRKHLLRNIIMSTGTLDPLGYVVDSIKDICAYSVNKRIELENKGNSFLNYISGNPYSDILIITSSLKTFDNNKTLSEDDMKYIEIALKHSGKSFDDILLVNSLITNEVTKKDGDIVPKNPNIKNVLQWKKYIDYVIDFMKPKRIILLGPTSYRSFFENSNFFSNVGKYVKIRGIKSKITYSPGYLISYGKIRSQDGSFDEKRMEFLRHFKDAINDIQKE